MKKFIVIFLSILFALSLTGLVACGKDNSTTPPTQMKLTVNTDKQLELNVGDMYKIAYRVSGTTKGVTFTSSNEDVLTVDAFGNLTPKAKGEATVTVALVENPTIKSSITVTVTKTFFNRKTGYKNGGIDLTYEGDGFVRITGGQTQLLANDSGENWYFKVNLDHTGRYTSDDAQGRFGVGSFYVTDSVAIGEVMAWFGFKPDFISKRTFIPYVGGWRVQTNGQDPEISMLDDGEILDCSGEHGATFELIRYGTMHYIKITGKDKVAKYAYDCPSLEGKATYPGIYAQNQIIDVWDFEMTTDSAEIMEKLNNFQVAEEIELNGIGDKLFAGETYRLSSTVLPMTTFDKSVTYSVSPAVDGVTLKDNVLTIGENVTGTVTVVATANSNTEVTASKTFTVSKKAQSTSTVLDTGAVVGDNATLGEDSISANGTTYVPLLTLGNAWGVSFKLSATSTSGKVGLLAATKGYFDYTDFSLSLEGNKRTMSYGTLGSTYKTFAYLNDGASLSSVDVEILKYTNVYYVSINGTLVKKLTISENSEEYMPVLYTDGAVAEFTSIKMYTLDEINTKIDSFSFATGAFVTKTEDGKYILASKDFGSATNINWPPVNDYENGLKSAKTFTGDFEVEFTVSDIKPMLKNGEYDSKLLIYLRSESTTASIQFVIKGTPANPTVSFCPNLNDATWDEYPITNVNLLEGSHTIKVVKRSGYVELHIDGQRVFEGNSGLSNNGYWSNSTVFTPGISTFLCGATLSDVHFAEVK